MTDWISSLELSHICGKNRRNITIRATKEAWPNRTREGRGGGKEYAFTGLPEEIQVAAAKYFANKLAKESPTFAIGKSNAKRNVAKQQKKEEDRHKALQQGTQEFGRLQGKAKTRAEVRLLIVACYKQYIAPFVAQKQKVVGEETFIKEYNRKQLNFDADIYQVVQSVSMRSLRRWEQTLANEGAGALAGSYQSERKYMIDEHAELQTFCRGMLWHQPDIQATNLQEAIRAQIELDKIDASLPSISAVRRWLQSFHKEFELVLNQLSNPDDFKNRRQVAWGNAAENISRINQLWELDSTPSDVLLTDGRHSIIGGIDVYSRRPILIVHPTSSAEAVCLLMRKAILEFGIPDTVKTDNGKDYTSRRVMSVISSLEIEQVLTKPFAGDEKPFIERFFRTWAHGISTLLPGYGGHNVTKRQELRSRKSFADQIMATTKVKGRDGKMRLSKGADVEVSLSSKELQVIIDDWINNFYLHKHHRKLGCTPFEQWQKHRTTIRTMDCERTLDILLSPVPASSGRAAGVRVANKDAGIVVEGISYFAAELGERIGQNIYCSWNPHDIGQLYVFNPENMEFICIARNPDLAGQGVTLSELSKEARRQQSIQLAEQRKALRQSSKKIGVGDVAMDVLAAAKKRNASISGLPHRTEIVNTAAIRGAKQAIKEPEKQRMDRSEFERRREEQLQIDEALKAQEAKPRFRNQMEEFTYYLRQQDLRTLTTEEIVIMNDFRKAQPKLAKMAEGLKTGNSVKKTSR
ncbi:transposase [Photobacterium nomapromontoriensis]|uniref:transposase n=1 Tax=Photobacterium nomapromontoriensis TaxID=2910237 RepID=UPI003D0B3F90